MTNASEKKQRTLSPETLRKRASNAYIDAQAATAKAKTALDAALDRYTESADNECEARNECLSAKLPVNEEPARYSLDDGAPITEEPKP